MAEKAPKKLHSFRIALAVLLMLAALFALLFADSANRLVTTDYTVTSARLPADFDGFRIVQLSDLHAAEFGKDNARLVRAVAAAQPDLIVLTGDFIEAEDQIPVTLALARQLVPLAPVYFVSGNHDWASHAIHALFDGLADAGVTCLRNEFVTLQRGAGSIVLAGVDDPNGLADMLKPDEVAAAVQAEHPGAFTVLLGHRNYWVEEYPTLPVDVILCGHAHGGVVRLPGVGGLIGTDRTLFPDYTAGMFASGQYQMIVSRGLGQIAQLPRLLNNPEIVCLTLRTTN
ncbi:MAG: metallophosphoesterase [Clostridiales bacterium]|nr:metallophosphoesterase [Clostridiales bacterium]